MSRFSAKSLEDSAKAAQRLSEVKDQLTKRLDDARQMMEVLKTSYTQYKSSLNPLLRYIRIRQMVANTLETRNKVLPGIPCPGRTSSDDFWTTLNKYLHRYPLKSEVANPNVEKPLDADSDDGLHGSLGLAEESKQFSINSTQYLKLEEEKHFWRSKFNAMSPGDTSHELKVLKDDIKILASRYCSIRRELSALEQAFLLLTQEKIWVKYPKLKSMTKHLLRSDTCTRLLQTAFHDQSNSFP